MNGSDRAVAYLAAALVLGLGAIPAVSPAQAQGFAVSGEIGFGLRARQEYFGAEDYGVGPLGRGSFEALTFGPISSGTPGVSREQEGVNLRAAIRLVPERSASDYSELAGLEDVDFSLELGLGVAYETEAFRVFVDPRYGVIGHNAWVAEVGADAIFHPADGMEVSIGPRLFFGNDTYASTYFGVTAAEAAAPGSRFGIYDASGGLLSVGIDLRVEQELNENWSIRADLEISEFVNSAADSPIVAAGSARHAVFGVTLARRFSFGF